MVKTPQSTLKPRPLEEIYIRLMTSYMTLDDVVENEVKFEKLLDLINFCEDFPESSLEQYREFKDLVMQHGPFTLPAAVCRGWN